MSRKNGNHAQVIKQDAPARLFAVELTEEQIRLLMQMVKATPIQGTMQTLPQTLEKLIVLQEKLEGSLKVHVAAEAGL